MRKMTGLVESSKGKRGIAVDDIIIKRPLNEIHRSIDHVIPPLPVVEILEDNEVGEGSWRM